MCFSAPVSFATSIGIAAIGGVSLRTANRQQRLVAAVPFIFAAQQAVEGAQWLAVANGAASPALGYLYLLFAYLLWPVYVPIAVYAADPERRPHLRWLILAGAAVSAYLLIAIASQPLATSVVGASLRYDVQAPFGSLVLVLYLATTVGSLLVSSKRYLRWFGIVVGIGAAISAVFFQAAFASVWCYFAAAASALLAYWLWSERSQTNTQASHAT